MPISQFNRPRLLSNGDLEVSGPFDLEFDPAQLLGDVTIRFLLIQKLDGERAVIVDEVASWKDGADWRFVVPASRVDPRLRASRMPDDPDRTGKCRGVAQAIVIRNVPGGEPPLFDTFTWCVTTEVVRDDAMAIA